VLFQRHALRGRQRHAPHPRALAEHPAGFHCCRNRGFGGGGRRRRGGHLQHPLPRRARWLWRPLRVGHQQPQAAPHRAARAGGLLLCGHGRGGRRLRLPPRVPAQRQPRRRVLCAAGRHFYH
jgi:hypothetical protein